MHSSNVSPSSRRPSAARRSGGTNVLVTALILCASALTGCASYSTPGGPADFRALNITEHQQEELTTPSIARVLDRKPAADFPATVAIVRVQDAGYRSYTSRGYGGGQYSVVTTRDVETDEELQRLRNLPMTRRIATLNRLVIPADLRDDRDLREAAASVQADMLLLYTFDTEFDVKTHVRPLGVFTLGLFPDEEARVTSTASAALMDTRTGYVYGLAESTDKGSQLANAWTSRAAVDSVRRRTERNAFADLVGEVETMWSGVLERFASGKPATQPDADSAETAAAQPPSDASGR